MAHGGKRSGAGRRKGVPNRVTSTLRERLLASGPSPLEVLVDLYRSTEPTREPGENAIIYATRYKQWAHDRLEAAKAAAPFFHPKLQSIEITGTEDSLQSKQTIQIEFVDPPPNRCS